MTSGTSGTSGNDADRPDDGPAPGPADGSTEDSTDGEHTAVDPAPAASADGPSTRRRKAGVEYRPA